MAFDLTYLVVGIALLLAAFVKGATGLGFPLIATPTIALLLDIRTAVTVLILPNLFIALSHRNTLYKKCCTSFVNLGYPGLVVTPVKTGVHPHPL
jgi:uncharacterized membrane protein YfcA